jgi:hypothetical protein
MICSQLEIEYNDTPIAREFIEIDIEHEPEPNLLHADIEILAHDLTWKPISQLKINDELFPQGNRVVAKIHKCIPTTMWNGYGIGNIVYDNHQWNLLSNIQSSQSLTIHRESSYNIATTRGFFITRRYIVRDYLELSSAPRIFDIIEEMNILRLNLNHS